VRIFGRAQGDRIPLVVRTEFRFRLTQAFQFGLDNQEPRIQRFHFCSISVRRPCECLDLLFLIDALAEAPISLQCRLSYRGA